MALNALIQHARANVPEEPGEGYAISDDTIECRQATSMIEERRDRLLQLTARHVRAGHITPDQFLTVALSCGLDSFARSAVEVLREEQQVTLVQKALAQKGVQWFTRARLSVLHGQASADAALGLAPHLGHVSLDVAEQVGAMLLRC